MGSLWCFSYFKFYPIVFDLSSSIWEAYRTQHSCGLAGVAPVVSLFVLFESLLPICFIGYSAMLPCQNTMILAFSTCFCVCHCLVPRSTLRGVCSYTGMRTRPHRDLRVFPVTSADLELLPEHVLHVVVKCVLQFIHSAPLCQYARKSAAGRAVAFWPQFLLSSQA